MFRSFALGLAIFITSSCAFARLSSEYTARISPFTTDGCSASPEGVPSDKTAWLHCCLEHDISYWQGGPRSLKLAADRKLRSCIAESGHPTIAQIYYYAVRAGGGPRFETGWRWGYGWPYKIGFDELTSEQLLSVEEELQFAPSIIEEYIRNYPVDTGDEENQAGRWDENSLLQI